MTVKEALDVLDTSVIVCNKDVEIPPRYIEAVKVMMATLRKQEEGSVLTYETFRLLRNAYNQGWIDGRDGQDRFTELLDQYFKPCGWCEDMSMSSSETNWVRADVSED